MRILFIILAGILGIILGVFGFHFYQKNIFSKEALKLEIFGPEKAEIYQEIKYLVKFKNSGNIRLEEPELIFEYPKYSLLVEGRFLRKTLSSEKLGGAIYPGQERQFHFRARLVGKEGEVKTAKATLSYRPKNLQARYESMTTFTTIISQVPITFEFDFPSKVEAGREIQIRLNYFSNLDYPLSNLRCIAKYPAGFEFIESKPKALGKTEWEIGLLNRAEGGRIEILGKLEGEIGETKIFQAKLGIWQEGEFILLKEVFRGVEIVKPSLYISQQINRNPQYLAKAGDWLHYEIFFQNIGDKKLTNLFLINQLEGEAFDFQTLKSDLGNFHPGGNAVIFDWRRVAKLQSLAPMEQGKVDFWIKLKDDLGNLENPVLRNKVFLSHVEKEFVTKVKGKIELIQKGYFQNEVFENLGPLPPRVGQTTTYCIFWQVKNYYSDVKNIKVKAILPEGVELTGKIFPKEEVAKFSFDSQSREIVWHVGDLKRGAGIFKPGKTLVFQIKFTPREFQRGQTPEIISRAKISGEDQWSETILEAEAPSINTTLPDDPTITEEMGRVQ